jgi:TolB-like protein/Flp pilus assembly protein TadD
MSAASSYRFGPFRFDARGRVLMRGDKDLGLPPKAADTLLLLLRHAREVVDRNALLDGVWGDVAVGEGSLTRTISILRKALGGRDASDTYIATVSKRGYRFVAAVEDDAAPADDGRAMLAVLPFENLSAPPRHDYWSDGLTEEMIAQLSRLNPERLGVIARTSSMMFKGTRKRVGEIGRDLRVHYLLEGSVRRGRGRVRISAQLVKVSDETQLWAEHYERRAGDVLRLQREVAEAIAREIQVKLAPRAARRPADAGKVPAPAYEAYLKARHLLNRRTEAGMRNSIALFETALRHFPGYAAAYAGVADANVMLACRGMVPAKETFRRARAAATRALGLDPDLGDAHASLAHVRLHDWDWEDLDLDFRRATELNPSLAIVHYWRAEYLMSRGRRDEAIAATETATRLDPLSAVVQSGRAMILYLARRFEQAAALVVHALQGHPDHFLLHLRLGLIRVQQKRYDDALDEIRTAIRLSDKSTETLAALGVAHAARGDERGTRRVLAELERRKPRQYVLPYNVARIHAAARDRDRAFACLETAYEGGNPDLIELNSEPLFDPIRRDPRFKHLLRRIGCDA